MESYQGGADEEYRGRNGPLKVTDSNEPAALRRADQGGRTGRHPLHQGLQRRRQDGIGMTQTTIAGAGRRMSTAVCYLDPARGGRT
jgi:choline dehydrogenase